MGAAKTIARESIKGDLVEFDMRRLRRQAAPEYRQGGGAGVDEEVIRAMLDRMIEVLGWPGGSDADHDSQTALKLIRALLRRHEMCHRVAGDSLKGYEAAVAEGDLDCANERMETLRLCVEPIGKVIVY